MPNKITECVSFSSMIASSALNLNFELYIYIYTYSDILQVIMELRTMHAIVHSGVLRSFESFLDNGAIVIMMEYMDGGSLADIVAVRTVETLLSRTGILH